MTTSDRIHVTLASDGWYEVRSPYEAKDLIKQIPGRQWDKAKKCWRFPEWAREDAVMLLYTWDEGVSWPSSRRQVQPVQISQSWAERMFDELPAELHGPAFRSLSLVLHPDQGGSDAAMRQLLAARAARAPKARAA